MPILGYPCGREVGAGSSLDGSVISHHYGVEVTLPLSVVLTTSALAPGADQLISSGGKGRPYSERAWLLRSVLLPAYTKWFPERFREVIVVGEWEEGEGYTYVPFKSVYKNCADALIKRQAGFEALEHTSVPWVLFQHDDHLWDPTNLIDPRESAYVLSPSRWTRARNPEGERLADGAYPRSTMQYVNGHACLMKPHVFREGFSWATVPPVFTWDIAMSSDLERRGVPMRYAPELKVWDVEVGAEPWK